MAVQKKPVLTTEVDLEATAELPAIDFTDTVDASAVTDIFQAPVIPAGVTELADSLREVEHRLQRRSERVAKLEDELTSTRLDLQDLTTRLEQVQTVGTQRETALREQLAQTELRLTDLQRDHSSGQRALEEVREQLQTQRNALAEAQSLLQQRTNEQRHQDHDLAELRRRSERQHEALTTWQGFRAVSEAEVFEREEQLRQIEGQHAGVLGEAVARQGVLQAELAFARDDAAHRIAALEESARRAEQTQLAQTEALRIASEHAAGLALQLVGRDTQMAELQQELTQLRAVEERARVGAASYDEQRAQIAQLQADLATACAKTTAFEEHLRVAEERIRRLEGEAHASAALLGNLQQNIERLGRDDTGARPALMMVSNEVAGRVLIRQEGGAEVVYPLGKRTTVGRTAENDIQIDTTFVSRHHAVLLSNMDHCIVEDLNSTNGVYVNGRRVGRHVLHDGDTVTVGRTEFMYQQRS
jgi:chromosome segregation ATPase